MKSYVIRFVRKGQTEIEQLEIEGGLTLWREDAGYHNENMMDRSLRTLDSGPHTTYADEEGITSIVTVVPNDT